MSMPVLNPALLSENELHEEYLVRGIRVRGAKGLDQLIAQIDWEFTGTKPPPDCLPTMNVQAESNIINDLLLNLESLIEDCSKTKDPSLLPVLTAKHCHLFNRVVRFTKAVGEREPAGSLVLRLSDIGKSFAFLKNALEIVGEPVSVSPVSPFASRGLQRSPTQVSQGGTNGDSGTIPISASPVLTQPSQDTSDTPASSTNVSFHNQAFKSAYSVSGTTNISGSNVDGGVTVGVTRTTTHISPSLSQPNQSNGFSSSSTSQPIGPFPHQGSSHFTRNQYDFPPSTQPPPSAVPSTSIPANWYFPTQQSGVVPPPASSFFSGFSAGHQQSEQGASNFATNPYVPSGPPQFNAFRGPDHSNQSRNFSGTGQSQTGTIPKSTFPAPQQYATANAQSHDSVPNCNNAQANHRGPYKSSGYSQSTFSVPQQPTYNAQGHPAQPVRAHHEVVHMGAPQNIGRANFSHHMAKWNLRFHGNGKDLHVDDFLFRADTLARSANIGLDELPRCMHYLLHGDALDWFWDYHRNNPLSTWVDFVQAMRHQYSPIDTDLEIFDKIRSRKQCPGETFAKFAVDISMLATRLRNPLSEAEQLEHLRANMNSGLRSALLFQPSGSIHQLKELAKRYEKLSLGQAVNSRFPIRRISELDDNPFSVYGVPESAQVVIAETELPDHNAIEAVVEARKPLANRVDLLCCWNCDEMGHTFADCEVATRNVFCYGCGAKNTYRPSCTKCKTGNFRPGGSKQPLPRPTQILARAPNPFAPR